MPHPANLMGIICRNGTYYAEFFDAARTPKARRFSLHTRKRADAWRAFFDLERAWQEGLFDPWTQHPDSYRDGTVQDQAPGGRPRTLGEAVDAFLDRKRDLERSANTIRTYAEVLSLALRVNSQDLPLGRLRAEQFQPMLRCPQVSDATRFKRYGHLRTFMRWMVRERLLTRNPLDSIEPPRKPSKLPKAVTEQELEDICSAIQKKYDGLRLGAASGSPSTIGGKKHGSVRTGEMIWRIPLFRFAFCTGMRASELARLRWRDIDHEKRLIYIRRQKNRKEQTIPLNTRAEALLGQLRPGESENYVFRSPRRQLQDRSTRSFVTQASRAFREGRHLAMIERKISFHGLRHGFCTRLAEAGKPLYVIKEAARHAEVATSLIYVHMANEHLKAQLDEVFR